NLLLTTSSNFQYTLRNNLTFAYVSFLCTDSFFFFNDPATPEIYTLSLHDALPISRGAKIDSPHYLVAGDRVGRRGLYGTTGVAPDRKSTRLNSSHVAISYAVFCLKKKKY